MRDYRYRYQEPPYVIHRSANRIIVAGQTAKPNIEEGVERGWRSPETEPYKAIGVFNKVVPVIEELKSQLEYSNEFSVQSQKSINEIRRAVDSIYVNGKEPQRTWASLARGVVSL